MKLAISTLLAAAVLTSYAASTPELARGSKPEIIHLDPPEKDFFSKELLFHGIPIKSHEVVSNEALFIAYDKLSMMLAHLPMIVSNQAANHVELHIIGRDQVTTDLPEWRKDKGKPLEEYHGLTRDQRTRGMGGRLTSCGEENILKLDRSKDRYYGRDICLHEFAHAIRNYGMPRELRNRFNQQYTNSLAKGLWVKSYAGSNPDEYFAELTMWYFGTHGDMNMTGPKPENGTEGLKKYDPEAFKLFDDFYQGRIPVEPIKPWKPAEGEDD
jgi:alpha-glucosidase